MWLNVVVSCVCGIIKLFYIAFCLVGAVYKFVCGVVMYGDEQKDGWNLWQWSKGNSNWQYSAHDSKGSPPAGPLQISWSWHNIWGWTAVCGAYTDTERYAVLLNYRLPAELCIATHSSVCVFESGKTLPGRSVVSLAATTLCRLQLCTVLGSSASHCTYNIPRTAISTSSLFCTVSRQNRYISVLAHYVQHQWHLSAINVICYI